MWDALGAWDVWGTWDVWARRAWGTWERHMGHISEARMRCMGEGSVDNYRRSVSRWCIHSPSMTVHL